ncbi:MAG: hypothetical protein AMXMBFR56_59180 [Polyangiaceae bacterium]
MLAAAREVLEVFASRPDLGRHAKRLSDSGIAGTSLHFPFHWVTARWLAERWPAQLHVDWQALSGRERERFEQVLPLLLPYAEWPDPELGLSPRQWLERLKGPRETDATFLIRRFAALGVGPRERESLFHDLGKPLRLDAAPGSPSRSTAWLAGGEPVFQRRPLSRARPPVAQSVRRRLRSVEPLSRRDGQQVIELARTSLISRGRDLDGIMYASPDDVRLIDAGGGLSLACLGLAPEHRALVETLYVFLLLKNGVPVGYYQAALLFESAEVNYHVFTTFRGVETSEHYVRALGVVHQLFGSNAFAVHPYQLGHENRDALRAGAFWFYRKLGFAPENPRLLATLRREERLARRDPAYRSSPNALRRLASDYVFLYLGQPRDDIAGKLPLSAFSLAVSDFLAARFGSDRERGLRVSARELAELTDTRLADLSRTERLAWERLAPLALALPGVGDWSRRELHALAELVRAKGAVREEEFARQLDRHGRARRALLELAANVTWPARENARARR